MRKFRFIGTEEQALNYVFDPQNAPVNGMVYNGEKVFGVAISVETYATLSINSTLGRTKEWEEVFEEEEIKNAL